MTASQSSREPPAASTIEVPEVSGLPADHDGVRFEVLGPVRAMGADHRPVRLSDLRRRLLARLLVRANRSVSTSALTDLLWGGDLPQRPDKSLQIHIHRIRQALDRPDRLRGVPEGYLLEVGTGELDAEAFETLHRHAREQFRAGNAATAIGLFRRALELWRSPPYADVDHADAEISHEVRRLAEARLLAYEELYDAELHNGAGRELVPELTELVAAYPLREHLTGQLMRALNRAGRRNRALATYQQASRRLAEELRTEPGANLRELYEAIRSDLPRPSVGGSDGADADGADTTGQGDGSSGQDTPPDAPDPILPQQLPSAPGPFTGRTVELTELVELTDATGTGTGSPVALITGMAGIGKTGLALQFAHQIATTYPDGQLYLDLRGHASQPEMSPLEALGHLARGLGADPRQLAIADVAVAAAEYRSLLAGRKVLLVLDNAGSADQVRPLLPAGPGSLALITSRRRLSGLVARDGVRRLALDVLSPREAHRLLIRLLGPNRLATDSADPQAAAALIDICGGLPLAIRIAAAQLADQPRHRLDDYVQDLKAGPVAALRIDDDEQAAVATAFDLSHRRLEPETQRAFRMLGLIPGPDFTVEAAAALLDRSVDDTRHRIDRLLTSHLLAEPVAGRFRFHDLLRDHARSLAAAEPNSDAHAALERLATWYFLRKEALATALRPTRIELDRPPLAAGVSAPTFSDQHAASSWAVAEHANIRALVDSAGDGIGWHWAWDLSVGYCTVISELAYLREALAMSRIAVHAAEREQDSWALARSLNNLGIVQNNVDARDATATFAEAVRHAETADDPILLSMCLTNLAVSRHDLGDLAGADTAQTRAVSIRRSTGAPPAALAVAQLNLGSIAALRGRYRRAAELFRHVTRVLGEVPSGPRSSAIVGLQAVRIALGELDDILEELAAAEASAVECGESRTELHAQIVRALFYLETGRWDQALATAERAKDRADATELAHFRARSSCMLARGLLLAGDTDRASVELTRALTIARDAGEYQPTVEALLGLADVDLTVGRPEAARTRATEVLDLTSADHLPDRTATLTTLARVDLITDRTDGAVEWAEAALALGRSTGHRLGQARALQVLGEALIRAPHGESAARGREHLAEAERLTAPFRSAATVSPATP